MPQSELSLDKADTSPVSAGGDGPVKILHTADVHLGLPFTRGYPDAVQQALVAARLETLTRLVDRANAEGCGLLTVGGDLFDTPRVAKTLVRDTAAALNRFEGTVAVLPGNHDYLQSQDDPLWPVFADALGERHLLLREERPYDLRDHGLPVVLFPAICRSRHSKTNAIGWVSSAAETFPGEEVLRIGLAHGSLQGLSPDFQGDYFPMTAKELEAAGPDLWLLGHTHIRFPDKDTTSSDLIFFPANPEPDGFDCRHGGWALLLEATPGGNIAATSLATGTYRFHTLEHQVLTEEDLNAIEKAFSRLRPENDLVKLILTGRLDRPVYDGLSELRKRLEERVLYLEFRAEGVVPNITQQEIDREFTEGSFPHRLLSEIAGEEDDPVALQVAYELIQGARVS